MLLDKEVDIKNTILENKISHSIRGLNMDSVNWQIDPGFTSFAMNANIQSQDGNRFTYTNELSNQLCIDFKVAKPGFEIVGLLNIIEQSRVIVFLAHPDGRSEIGEITNYDKDCLSSDPEEEDCGCTKGVILEDSVTNTGECCKYTPILTDDCVSCCECRRQGWRNNYNYAQNVYYTNCEGIKTFDTILAHSTWGTDVRVGSVTTDPGLELVVDVVAPPGTINNCGKFNKNNCCLKFSINTPVYATYKQTPCGTNIYFVERKSPIRYLTLENPTGKDACGQDIECIDDSCHKLNVFPETCHPDILPILLSSGGNIKAGTVQFSIAYADRYGNELTDYFDLTNPVSIFDRKITHNTDYETNKSVRLKINHNTDTFDFYNIVVAHTVDTTTLYYLIETRRVTGKETITYTGNHKEEYSSVRVLNRTPAYETANIIESSDEILFLGDLESAPEYNLQPVVNFIKLNWETISLPANKPNYNYSNGIVGTHFRSYMRDEVYPFGIKFKLKNGKYTRIFHIPGRAADSTDLAILPSDNKDVFDGTKNCPPNTPLEKWRVYNTARRYVTPKRCTPIEDELKNEFDCAIFLEEQGDFAYWESTHKYPCNPEIWGPLADTPVRFHKFPDCAITHIHSYINNEEYAHPIGVRPDEDILNTIINNPSDDGAFFIYNPITKKKDIRLSDIICGFEIVRGNRVGNKSVIAKGLTYDVCSFEDKDNSRKYYYPNYPYNDLREDPFLSKNKSIYDSSSPGIDKINSLRHNPFPNKNNLRRYTFHSPDTHFQNPKIGTELKVESCEYGRWKGHFVPVDEHPKYKLLTPFDMALSAAIGTHMSISTSKDNVIVPTLGFNWGQAVGLIETIKNVITEAIPKVNYAWQYNSVGNYNKFTFPNPGDIRRPLDLSAYLSPYNQEIGDDKPIFNNGRESSVYLRTSLTKDPIKSATPVRDDSRNTLTSKGGDWCSNPKEIREGDIKANYCSIKREFPDQYGPIENVKYVDTGDFYELEEQGLYRFVKCKFYPTFGGDIFINKFSLKRKMPFFNQNMVGRPDEVDFSYWLVPNIAYPTYYVGTAPDELEIQNLSLANDIIPIVHGIGGIIAADYIAYPPWPQILNAVGTASLAVGLTNLFSDLLTNLLAKVNFDCDNTAQISSNKLLELRLNKIKDFGFDDWLKLIGFGTVNLELALVKTGILDSFLFHLNQKGNYFYKEGKFYLASYGIPTFFVESDINVDMRHGRNAQEENFYPNVSGEIPDDWLQEKNVPIAFDNYYSYNRTYSKQNYENYNEPYNDFEPDQRCKSYFPNRVIYSDPTDREERKDSWRIFRANNYFDFPKTNGKLISLNSIENDKILARFENTTAVYNSRVVLDSSHPIQIELGTGGIFAQKPIEYVKADIGYLGTQNRAYLSCKYGSFWTDAKRGFVYNISNGLDEISKTNYNWFKQNLPFNIVKDFPNYPLDNNFKDVGISLGWDERYERVFLTKKDYKLIKPGTVTYDPASETLIEVSTGKPVELTNGALFEDKSFTIAYSPLVKNWISFYSFLPNGYIALTNHFQTFTRTSVWNHLISPLSYQTFYNKLHPYIIEYPLSFAPHTVNVNSLTIHQDIQKYYNNTDFYSLNSIDNDVNFNKAIIYNKEQCSGNLNLVYQKQDDLRQLSSYPRVNPNSIDILYSKKESKYTFNGFKDIAAHNTNQPVLTSSWTDIAALYPIDKVPNSKTLSYTRRIGDQMPIRAKECRIRLINDKHDRYKFISHFLQTQINQSII